MEHLNVFMSIFRAGQLFLEPMKTKTVVNALIEDTTQRTIPFHDQNIPDAPLISPQIRPQPGRPTANDNSVEALVLCLIEFLFALLAAGAFPIFRQIFKGYPFMLRRIIYISLLIYSLAPPGADLSVFGLHKGPDLEIVFSILLKSVYCL